VEALQTLQHETHNKQLLVELPEMIGGLLSLADNAAVVSPLSIGRFLNRPHPELRLRFTTDDGRTTTRDHAAMLKMPPRLGHSTIEKFSFENPRVK
jgi:hypothetical protein